MKKIIKLIPSGLPTLLILALVAYISLAANPLDINDVPLFPGADKLIHAFMYFCVTTVCIFDYAKHRLPHHTKVGVELAFAAAAATYGLLMEMGQLAMQLGRNYDNLDIVANAIGCVIAFLVIHFWLMHRFRVMMLSHRRHHQ